MTLLKKSSVWIAFLVALLGFPLIFDSILAISILNQMAIAIVFALSYNMLLGQGGCSLLGTPSTSAWAASFRFTL